MCLRLRARHLHAPTATSAAGRTTGRSAPGETGEKTGAHSAADPTVMMTPIAMTSIEEGESAIICATRGESGVAAASLIATHTIGEIASRHETAPPVRGDGWLMRICGSEANRSATSMVDRLEQLTKPTESQRSLLEALKDAAARASEIARGPAQRSGHYTSWASRGC